MDTQRLRDHLRRAAGAVRPAGRPAQSEVRLPARRRHLHRRFGGVRCCGQRADADRLPARAGGWRGAAHAHLARSRAGQLPGGAPGWRRSSLDRGWCDGGRARPGDRRPAGRGELALGLPGQRPHRRGRAHHRMAQAAGRARAPRTSARRAVRAADHGRCRRAHPGPGARRRLGLGFGAHRRHAGRGRRCYRAVRIALRAPSQSAG